MIEFQPKGAIFDVDDTLLDNKPGVPTEALHERSRLAAVHDVGRRHKLQQLLDLTPQQNLDAFMNASVHTLEAAVWNILRITGIADQETIDPNHPLLHEIASLKDELHADILLNKAEELPGACDFVRALGKHGLELAIASTAVRRDIDLFLGKMGLAELFPDARIKSKESTTHHKPNPEVYNAAFASLNLAETDRPYVCAFEDDPRGIMAAKGAGLYTCAITSRFSREELARLAVPPDLAADSYAEFSQLFGV